VLEIRVVNHSRFQAADVRFGSFADIRRSKPGAALSPKADIEVTHRHVCFGPFPESSSAASGLFDQFVGTAGKREWKGDIERGGGLEVDV